MLVNLVARVEKANGKSIVLSLRFPSFLESPFLLHKPAVRDHMQISGHEISRRSQANFSRLFFIFLSSLPSSFFVDSWKESIMETELRWRTKVSGVKSSVKIPAVIGHWTIFHFSLVVLLVRRSFLIRILYFTITALSSPA